MTVWLGCWGDKYPQIYLERLIRAVERNLTLPHRLNVMGDERSHLAGWWRKLELFARDDKGTNLWIDLDSVIVAPLDAMVKAHENDRIAMAKNWAQSGHDSCQSSVMIWQGGMCQDLYDDICVTDMDRLWGDQEWITERYGRPGDGIVTPIAHPQVVSYKYHCRDGPPKGACVVTFHGEPKPSEVTDSWVTRHWS